MWLLTGGHGPHLPPRPLSRQVIAGINPAVGVVEPVDENSCLLLTGADAMETIAIY